MAIPFWYSIHNVVVQQLFRDNGLTPVARAAGSAIAANEVNLLVLPPSDMPPALASNWPSRYKPLFDASAMLPPALATSSAAPCTSSTACARPSMRPCSV